jgi:hypothetical protein
MPGTFFHGTRGESEKKNGELFEEAGSRRSAAMSVRTSRSDGSFRVVDSFLSNPQATTIPD